MIGTKWLSADGNGSIPYKVSAIHCFYTWRRVGIGLIWCQHWTDCVLSLWVNGIVDWQTINGSAGAFQSLTGTFRAMTNQWTRPAECQYIFNNGFLQTHLIIHPFLRWRIVQSTGKGWALREKGRACWLWSLISIHDANFFSGLTTVTTSRRAVNRLSERWMLKAKSCGRNWTVPFLRVPGNARKPQFWPVPLNESGPTQGKSMDHDHNLISSVRIHEHAKFYAIPSMRFFFQEMPRNPNWTRFAKS